MNEIISIQNPLVKHLVKLRENKSYRYAEKRTVIEGVKLVKEVCHYITPSAIFITEKQRHLEKEIGNLSPLYIVSENVMKKITGVINPEGILAEVPLSEETKFKKVSSLLVLEAINDPGNLGTLIRSALALGWDGVYFLPDCCDPYNEKAMRASKGGIFHLSHESGSWERLLEIAKQNNLTLFVADLEGQSVDELSNYSKPCALVLGNEAKGVSKKAKQICNPLTIPMKKMESLNVGVAGGILLYLLRGNKNV